MNDKPSVLLSDRPLTDPKKDKLGRVTFADQVATGISDLCSSDGLVLSVQGPWGSGKTTIINFIRKALESLSDDKGCDMVDFNPWMLGDERHLVEAFFSQLKDAVSKSPINAEELSKAVSDILDAAEYIPEVGGFAKALNLLHRIRTKRYDLPDKKKRLDDLLVSRARKIVVFIDDIDRLVPSEICELFRMVKAVGDLSNVIYVLAFDRKAIADAVSTQTGCCGEDYLEKIVQVPFEVPIPGHSQLREMLIETINDAFKNIDVPHLDKNRTLKITVDIGTGLTKHPRHITRLVNHLRLAITPVANEVDFADFLGITALQVFAPDLYRLIEDNPDAFCNQVNWDNPSGGTRLDPQKFHESWLNQIESHMRDSIKSIVRFLFPMTEKSLGGMYSYSREYFSEWRRQRRICSPEVFPVYFRLAVPDGDISNMEMQAILATARDCGQFGSRIRSLAEENKPDGVSRVCQFLGRLVDYHDIIDVRDIPNIAKALLDAGDFLNKFSDRSSLFSEFDSNKYRVVVNVIELVRRLPPSDRSVVINDYVKDCESLVTPVELASLLGIDDEQNSYTNKDAVLNEEERELIVNAALERIAKAASCHELETAPGMERVVIFWDKVEKELATQWIDSQVSTKSGLLQFVSHFIRESRRITLSTGEDTVTKVCQVDSIDKLVSADILWTRIDEMLKNDNPNEADREIAKLFAASYRALKAGKDPTLDSHLQQALSALSNIHKNPTP